VGVVVLFKKRLEFVVATVVIPATGDRSASHDAWRECIGTGRLSLALRKDYLQSLALVQKEIGFRYIRGHGLLHDDVGIYREYQWQGQTCVLYNFTYLDQIFDSFLGLGLKPFVEIGFMPGTLASSGETVFWWKGNVTPPRDYDRWRGLIHAVVTHLVARYGLEEVLTWPFEIWNEPNLSSFWKDADQAAYFTLYRETVAVIKGVDARFRVGGPAICGGADHWLADFLSFCEREAVPVDFLSRHAYSSDPREPIPFAAYQRIARPESLLEQFATGRQYAQRSAFPDLPVHITEFNSSYLPVNPVHDSAFNAAYLATVLSRGGDMAQSFSYWTFCDVFEEENIPTSLFHGGFGLLTHHQVKKPTYHLFEFFAHLSGERLYRDDHLHVVRRDDGSIALLAWNCVYDDDGPGDGAAAVRTVTVSLPVAGSDVFAQRRTVNEDVGNSWTAWKRLGRPRFPTREQIAVLKECSAPAVSTSVLHPAGGRVDIELTLARNEITLVELTPIREESQGYPGLDDARVARCSP
jgi:xylan 1,4-beta-xylosidase